MFQSLSLIFFFDYSVADGTLCYNVIFILLNYMMSLYDNFKIIFQRNIHVL